MTIRKEILYALIMLPWLAGNAAVAQSSPSAGAGDADMKEARAEIQAARADVVRQELLLTEVEAKSFWPAYAAYNKEMQTVRDERVDLITQYLEAYDKGSISEEFATRLVDKHFAIQSELLKIQKKHLKNFRRTLPARKVARFYQLENKLDADVNAQLALVIPLVDPT